ncbi:ATP-binding protein [Chitinophaga sp. 212800010-3]|uniref:ATP-binding protein n=1 Tax=unclassified Chitinophaga TaxID=2619133 RepID=UPI002DF1C5B7|nr:Histidine kinase [Chitinophaga sp. 212800010-3]
MDARNVEYIQRVLQLTPMGIILYTFEGECFFVNSEWERISGLNVSQSLGNGWMSIIMEDDRQRAVSSIVNRRQEILRIRHSHLGIRHLKVQVRPCPGIDGQPFCLIGHIQDVTGEQLQGRTGGSERQTWLLLESQRLNNVGGWEYDLETTEIYMTPQTHHILEDDIPPGFRPVYKDLLFFCDERYAAALEACVERAIKEKIPYDYEFLHVTGKWLRLIGVPVTEDGRVVKLRGTLMDVSDKKQNELALIKAREELLLSKQLLDISQAISKTGGWELNPRTGEVFWTRQTYIIYGLPENYEPAIGTSLEFFEESDREYILNILDKTVREQTSFILELRTTTGKNEKKWVRIIGEPVVKEGEVVALRGAIMDITDKKEDELTLIRAKNIAEEAARVKTEFLSVMSHEIRTPLNGIIGLTALLEQNHTPQQEEYINNLAYSAEHLLQLVNDVLDLHKVESGNMKLSSAEINLFKLPEDIFSLFRPQAAAKGIALKSDVAGEVPLKVLGDPVRLSQILNNLVSNAIKYTESGEVMVAISLVAIENSQAVIHFSVKDTGIGIPEELHETVFETFTQGHKATTREYSGTGLGLSITQKLIELHNSTIAVKSSPGQGAEFYFNLTFNLPLQKAPVTPASRLSPVAGHEKRFAGMRVLLVEDNNINIIVARKQLQYFGIEPDCARDAQEALEMLRNKRYHLAMLDLHMPKMDGYELSEIVSKNYPDVHIVIFTADIMDDVRIRLAEMNIFDILHKPLLPAELLQTLQRVVQLRAIRLGVE